MTTKKSAAKKNSKKDEAIEVKVEELIPDRAKVSLTCRFLILTSFVGIALLVYDKIEPGSIPFFKDKKETCENPIHDIADNINDMMVEFSGRINNAASVGRDVASVDLQPIVNSIRESKMEILNSVSEYINEAKLATIQESKGDIEEKITNAKQDAEAEGKQKIVIDLVKSRISRILEKKYDLKSQKEELAGLLGKAKERIFSSQSNSKSTSGNEEQKESNEISRTIKDALGKFVKVKKVDDEFVMLAQLFLEAEELLEAEEFEALSQVLNEIKSISQDDAIDELIQKSRSLRSYEEKAIEENLKEVLSLIEKLRISN